MVKCQLDVLVRQRTEGAIKAALCTLPRDLDQMYEAILTRIAASDEDSRLARTALIWLTHSRRPLTLKELAEAAVLSADMTDFGPDDKLSDPGDILDILGSLISYVDGRVQLSHNSVRDYLRSPAVAKILPTFHIPDAHCGPELASICLRYLLLPSFGAGSCDTVESMRLRLETFPLLYYLSRHWTSHTRPYLNEDQTVFDLAKQFFSNPATPQFVSWIQALCTAPGKVNATYRGYPRHPTPLYFASSYDLVPIVEHLLESGADVNEPGGRHSSMPLSAACWRKNPDVARLLLRAGADIYAVDSDGISALAMANFSGDEHLRRVILEEKGATDVPVR